MMRDLLSCSLSTQLFSSSVVSLPPSITYLFSPLLFCSTPRCSSLLFFFFIKSTPLPSVFPPLDSPSLLIPFLPTNCIELSERFLFICSSWVSGYLRHQSEQDYSTEGRVRRHSLKTDKHTCVYGLPVTFRETQRQRDRTSEGQRKEGHNVRETEHQRDRTSVWV